MKGCSMLEVDRSQEVFSIPAAEKMGMLRSDCTQCIYDHTAISVLRSLDAS